MDDFFLNPTESILLLIIIIWSGVWKGIALWKAARQGALAWYIAMLVLSTVGILEIIYVYLISPKTQSEKSS